VTTIETYLRDAAELTQQVINAWGQNVAAGNNVPRITDTTVPT